MGWLDLFNALINNAFHENGGKAAGNDKIVLEIPIFKIAKVRHGTLYIFTYASPLSGFFLIFLPYGRA